MTDYFPIKTPNITILADFYQIVYNHCVVSDTFFRCLCKKLGLPFFPG